MESERFDAIVVGAGPAGNAAAYTMAKAGLNVLQLERGEYPGFEECPRGHSLRGRARKNHPGFSRRRAA